MKTFAELRKNFGMSIMDISKRFGVPYRTVQDWNAGRRNPPQYVLEMMEEILENEETKK